MGQGRRMKRKQGMPDALSEEHFANLKRKAGLPVEPPVEKASLSNKKRKTAKGAAVAKKPEPAPKKASAKKSNGKAKKLPVQEQDSEDEEMGDEFDLDQLEDDGSSDEDASSGGKKKNIWSDEENDSDDAEEDDSVFDSDDQEEGGKKGKFVFSDDEDESDAEEKLTAANIAGLSRRLDKKLAEDKAITETEMQESAMQINIDGPKIFGEEDDEDDELADKSKSLLAPDLQLLRQRITDTIRVLDDFANLAEEGRSRAEYTAQLLKDICGYYGYSPYLAEKLFNLFTPREAFAFFEANEMPRPVVIRTNTLRTHRRDLAQALINRGVTLEPVGKWSKVGLQIFEANVPLGATPEYLAGHYIIQAAASFLPVMALSPQPNERVLDMASAPGGKTTYCSAMMNNTGIVFANDPNKERAKGLIGNVARLGVRNVIVCSYDGREFPRVMGGFDRVLLDAPCSGTGVISKDPSVKTNKDEKDFISLPHMQKQLLLSAIDSVNHASETGGFLVYSTCSVTVEENESVVAYALSRRPNVKLVDAGIPFGKEGFTSYMGKKFHPSLKLTRRFYPHAHNIDGFYVAKFQKIGPTPPNAIGAAGKKNGNAAASGDEEVIDKTPITTDEDTEMEDKSTKKKSKGKTGTEKSDFSAFDEEEDVKYMEKAKKNAMRRRGLDPKSLKKPKSQEKK
ncbi:25S rRNA (cytosine-C(5))-methyltransferase nop2 [Trichoderma asperellum]|uniref:Nucleolar protein 2 n=1 Tax=Trichoderma asperellum TaxID=101201 RepID=A0A6V8QY12_TRIAP|nr:NOL1/NOP2/sun family putative RNA met [Trichoderma asperelloides]GFP55293.1 25S rRNA (cytosine-C(5))-methyltransferase nop2 [Trichoderma asperellum]